MRNAASFCLETPVGRAPGVGWFHQQAGALGALPCAALPDPGQSRESMAVFMVQSVKVITVVAVAQGMAIFGQDLSALFTDWRNTIAGVITGGSYQDPSAMVGEVMSKMLILQTAMDVFQGSGVTATSNIQMANTMSFISGAGMAMPALIGGGLLLLNEIALNLCLVFGPLCMLAYVFEPTRQIFVTWVKFSITTLFSMVVITVVTVIALKALIMLGTALVTIDAGSTIVGLITGGKGGMQLRDIATVSGGLGMLLTTLIVGTPPLVTNFFSGAMHMPQIGNNVFTSLLGGGKNHAGGGGAAAATGVPAVGANTAIKENSGNVPSDGISNKQLLGQNAATNMQTDSVKTAEQALKSTHTGTNSADVEAQRAASGGNAALGKGGASTISGSTGNPNAASGDDKAQALNTTSTSANTSSVAQEVAKQNIQKNTAASNPATTAAISSGTLPSNSTSTADDGVQTTAATRVVNTQKSVNDNNALGPGKRGAAQ